MQARQRSSAGLDSRRGIVSLRSRIVLLRASESSSDLAFIRNTPRRSNLMDRRVGSHVRERTTLSQWSRQL